ncbi:hypothetical protein AJ80_04625 [Polytolypa hystricis UAMH7299]|uniref:Uncharacterized protein n=1 Tax=Polytolypa hystricis (strain UAMH7299) TaxID=1447883 RepID=A0A2B7Y1P9_POLH7|nr:hypothetical protein AJ80_04625 [Polytolypa hystricis UAMH7299]
MISRSTTTFCSRLYSGTPNYLPLPSGEVRAVVNLSLSHSSLNHQLRRVCLLQGGRPPGVLNSQNPQIFKLPLHNRQQLSRERPPLTTLSTPPSTPRTNLRMAEQQQHTTPSESPPRKAKKPTQAHSPPLPYPYRSIRAKYTPDTITVYQAYPPPIANAALRAGKFVAPPFKRGRMTWIKPSFLWMAYRCGYASKENQERVLAVEICRLGWEWALENACLSTVTPAAAPGKEATQRRREWKKKFPVRVQWDPERDLRFKPLAYRSLQVGLSGEAVDRYVDEWIVGITDVTEQMVRIGGLVEQGKLEEAMGEVPVEEVYPLPERLVGVIGASVEDAQGEEK